MDLLRRRAERRNDHKCKQERLHNKQIEENRVFNFEMAQGGAPRRLFHSPEVPENPNAYFLAQMKVHCFEPKLEAMQEGNDCLKAVLVAQL
jgi:hypothetical protein